MKKVINSVEVVDVSELALYIYIIYTLTVFDREREQAALKGAAREQGGAPKEQKGVSREHRGSTEGSMDCI